MEKISILVPCCNVEKYVGECLESIKKQTYTNLEVICIDDGSKDSTGIIIDKYVALDNRFRVVHKPNTGYGDSMNKGLESCTGDYIGIVESDDWVEPEMFETMLRAAKENDLDLVRCCWYEGPTATERINDQSWVKKNKVFCPLDREDTFFQQPSIWVSLYRRDLLEEGRKIRFLPTPGASYQDTSFAFKVYTKSKRFMMLDKPLHHYRINPNSSVMSTGKVYCIVDEWEEMKRWICEDVVLCKKFSETSLFAKVCYGGAIWNYERLSTHVTKLLFLRRASRFFREAKAAGIFNLFEYSHSLEGKTILSVMSSPLDYHRNRISERLEFMAKYGDDAVLPASAQEDMISVVMTCYNTSKYIYSSLMSVVRQSYKNIEIICVDDCSQDDTEMVVRHFMRKDSRITWYCTQKNCGVSASRNLGIRHSHGKYIIFVDGDDCLLPNAVANLYAAMDNEDDLVNASLDVFYEGGDMLYGSLVESDRIYYKVKEDKRINIFIDENEAYCVHASVSAKLWRSSIIRDNEIMFPEGVRYEDACFMWKYLCVAPRMHLIVEPVYLYQRHLVGSFMSDTFGKKSGLAIQHILILDDIFRFVQEKHLEKVGRIVLSHLYEPFFWFAVNHSPECDFDSLLDNMCRILAEQQADTSASPVLDYVTHYKETSKGKLFIDAYHEGRTMQVDNQDTVRYRELYRLSKKLRKYRKLTKVFAATSALLLMLLLIGMMI